MITLFTIPKPFTDRRIDMIQQQAIWSWTELATNANIILCCDDEGVGRIAAAYGCEHLPDIERVQGVPLVSDAFLKVQEMHPDDTLIYVNCDMILFNSILDAVSRASEKFEEYLVIGTRWKWFNPSRVDSLKEAYDSMLSGGGREDSPVATDYFAFPSGQYPAFPAFVIGYFAWDTWLVSHSYIERDNIAVIDASNVVMAIHQEHQHNRHYHTDPLAQRNISMVSYSDEIRTKGRSDLAPWVMTPNGIVRRPA